MAAESGDKIREWHILAPGECSACLGVEAIGTEPRVVDLDEPSLLLSRQAGQSSCWSSVPVARMEGGHREGLLVQARLRSSCEC